MAERSILSFLLLGLVLALTFKDLVFLKQPDEQKAVKTNPSGQVDLNFDEKEPFESTDDFNNNKSGDDFTEPINEFTDSSESDPEAGFVSNEKTIPSLKMKSNQQTLRFQFCYSCGYRNMFEQYSQLINAKYPELKIVGENYAQNQVRVILAQVLSTLKIVLIGCVIFGQSPFGYFNIPTPQVFNWATENKFYACLMIFFVSNAIETQLITSGAFEIYLNDMQIWSKLQSDRIPHEKELLQIIDMNFNFEPEKDKKW